MPSLNKVMLIGNVGRDPEVRYLDGNGQNGQGTKVATFTLATTERYRDRSGELRENTEWHNIVAWRQTADVAERFIRKGTQVYIEGRLRTRSWTDAQGVKKYTTEITVDNLQMLGRRESDGSSQGGYQPQGGGYQQSGGYQQGGACQAPAAPRGQYSQPSGGDPAQQYGQSAAQPRQFGQSPAAQPGYSQPQQSPKPDSRQAIDLGGDDPTDDLPF